MLEITAILAAAAVVYAIGRATRIPVLPLLIIAGALFAVSGQLPDLQIAGMVVEFPDPMPDREFVIGMLQVGLAFLVFAAGMDMAPARVGVQQGLALKVGLIQFGALGLLTGWLTLRIGYDLQQALYVGLAISASSTLVVVRLLKKRRELFESFGRMIIGVLLLQDVLVIGALVFLTAVTHDTPEQILIPLETSLVMVAAAVLLSRWVMPWVVQRYRDDDETLLLVVLATLFAFVGLSHVGDVPMVVGAFLAGLSLSGFPTRALVRGLITSLTDFFMVVFFISLGALLELPSWQAVAEALVVVVLVLVITPLLVAYVAERAGMTSRGALEAGLLIAQTSEFSLIVALLGLETQAINDDLFAVIVLVTVVTMMVTPLWSGERFVRWLMRFHPSPGPKTRVPDRSNHVVVIGGGTAGTLLVDKLRDAAVESVIVDNDPMVTIRFRQQDCDAVWGDGEDEETLREAGVERARAVIVTTGDLHHLQQVRRLAPDDASIWLHAFEADQAEAARTMGAKTITYSEAAADALVEWFDTEFC